LPALTKRAFVHEVRTFLADPEFREKLESVRQLIEERYTGEEAEEEDKAA
jgi:hypothetical protein